MAETILKLETITKSFDGAPALKGISLEVARGEFLTLLGPSGCGKTTTLRIIAGLESPDSGRVLLEGQDVTGLEPNRRNVNTVFQSYALFPHMNVEQNIGYGLRLKKLPKEEIAAKVAEMLELVQLQGFEKRMPDQLSGGQRQRVALARALVNSPDVLLLDEPLGALDLQLRRQMQQELKGMQKKLGITFIYITHDQEEAMNMSDRIGIMHAGEIVQLGTPDDIYERPNSRFSAGFIGQCNIADAAVLGCENGLLRLKFGGGEVLAAGEAAVGASGALCVRPERVRFSTTETGGFSLCGVIREYSYTGGTLRTTIETDGGVQLLVTDMGQDDERLAVGTRVHIYWDPRKAVLVESGAKADA